MIDEKTTNIILSIENENENNNIPIANNLISIPKSLHDIFISVRCYIDNNIFNINSNNDINEVFPNLFVSNYSTMTNKDLLNKIGIKRIITVHSIFMPPYPNDFEYIYIPSYDIETDNLDEYFTMATNIISDIIRFGDRVLVHCYAGRSRSVSIALSYIFHILLHYHNNISNNTNNIYNNIYNKLPSNISILDEYMNEIKEYLLNNNDNNMKIDELNNELTENDRILSYVNKVIKIFQKRRNCASPNPHFVKLLCNYVKSNKLLIQN